MHVSALHHGPRRHRRLRSVQRPGDLVAHEQRGVVAPATVELVLGKGHAGEVHAQHGRATGITVEAQAAAELHGVEIGGLLRARGLLGLHTHPQVVRLERQQHRPRATRVDGHADAGAQPQRTGGVPHKQYWKNAGEHHEGPPNFLYEQDLRSIHLQPKDRCQMFTSPAHSLRPSSFTLAATVTKPYPTRRSTWQQCGGPVSDRPRCMPSKWRTGVGPSQVHAVIVADRCRIRRSAPSHCDAPPSRRSEGCPPC
jgi:hypothetical protein